MKLNPELSEIVISDKVGLDSEFNSLCPKTAKVTAISINTNGEIYVLDTSKYTKEALVSFSKGIKDSNTLCIGHNIKIDVAVLYSFFGVLLTNVYDTMVASQIIDNGYGTSLGEDWILTKNMVGGIFRMKSPHGLYGTIRRYLGIELDSEYKEELQKSFIGLKYGTELSNEQLEYAGEDVKYLLDLYEAEVKWSKERELCDTIYLRNRALPVIVKMELVGVLVDQEKQKENIKNWERDLKLVELRLDELLRLVGKEIRERYFDDKFKIGNFEFIRSKKSMVFLNYASSKQVLNLFVELGLPKPRDAKNKDKNKKKYSVSEDNLKIYQTEHSDSPLLEFIVTLLEHKRLSKAISTYGQKILDCLDDEGRMRTTYGLAFTETLRLNSSSILKKKKHGRDLGINLSNIPKDNEIRKIFIPNEGYSFIDSDMSGQEAILAASFSQEPLLMKAFLEGFDHHSYMASASYSIIFNRPVEILNQDKIIDVDGKQYNLKLQLRQDHKNAFFSWVYGGGKDRIYEYLSKYIVAHNVPSKGLSIADKVHKKLTSLLPVLIEYLDGTVSDTKKNGYTIVPKIKTRRYYDNIDSVYGDAMNMGIQSAGGSAMLLALIQIDKLIIDESIKLGVSEKEIGWISMSIYDQTLCCINDKYLYLKDDIAKIMGKSLDFFLSNGLKGSSDVKICSEWSK